MVVLQALALISERRILCAGSPSLSLRPMECGIDRHDQFQRSIHTKPNMFRLDTPQSSSAYVIASLHIFSCSLGMLR